MPCLALASLSSESGAVGSAPLSELRLARARHGMSWARLAPTEDPMEPLWGAGYDLLAASAGRGARYRPSCSSLSASQAATLLRRIPRVRPADFYSSSVIGCLLYTSPSPRD